VQYETEKLLPSNMAKVNLPGKLSIYITPSSLAKFFLLVRLNAFLMILTEVALKIEVNVGDHFIL